MPAEATRLCGCRVESAVWVYLGQSSLQHYLCLACAGMVRDVTVGWEGDPRVVEIQGGYEELVCAWVEVLFAGAKPEIYGNAVVLCVCVWLYFPSQHAALVVATIGCCVVCEHPVPM